MSEWEQTTLGDHLTRVKRKVQLQDGVEYAAVSVTKDGQGLGPKDPFIGGVTNYETLYRVHENDVVLRTITAFESPVGVAHVGHAATHVSGVFLTYEVGPSMLPGYLRLFFQSPRLWKEMQLRATGTVLRRKTISDASFRAIPVPTPSPAEQRRIVDVMGAVDAQIEAMAQELDRLLPLRIRFLLNSDDLNSVAIEQLADVSQGKALPKAVQGQRTGDISWFKIADMTGPGNEDGYICADTRLARDHVRMLKGAVVSAGSVVFPRVGAAVLTEKKRMLDVEAAVDENHLVLTPKGGVSPECLLAAVESIRLADLVQTGAVPSLNMGLIREAQIPWSIESNAQLAGALGEIRARVRKVRAELSSLRTFRSTLLTSLLNRDIEIPESYDRLLEEVS